jgi:Family of unknown function (DUF6088)
MANDNVSEKCCIILTKVIVMKLMASLRQHIERVPLGEPFTAKTLLAYAPRTAVDQTLSRLARENLIVKVARGAYVRPKTNAFVGQVVPSVEQVLQVRASSVGEMISLHGAEAARRFQLSTQVSTRPVFYTSGRSRGLEVAGQDVTLEHVPLRWLEHAGTPIGDAVAALHYLGKTQTTPETFAALERSLGTEQFTAFKATLPSLPGWVSERFYEYERGRG